MIATTQAPSLQRDREAATFTELFLFLNFQPTLIKKTEHAKTDAGLIHVNSCGVVKAKYSGIQMKGSEDKTLQMDHCPDKCNAEHQI